jgi:hypothetical protein
MSSTSCWRASGTESPHRSSLAATLYVLALVVIVDHARNKTPTDHHQSIRYGETTQLLQTSPERFHSELYDTTNESEFEFSGFINHSLTVQKAGQVTAGVDVALETLRNQMQAIKSDREASKYAACVLAAAGLETNNCPGQSSAMMLPRGGPQDMATVASPPKASSRSFPLPWAHPSLAFPRRP